MDSDILALAGLAALLTVTPGPDTMLVLRNVLRDGARGGIATAWGSAAGLLVHLAASSFGVSAVLVHSADAFAAVRLAGACYLVWLGGRALLAAVRGDSLPDNAHGTPPGTCPDVHTVACPGACPGVCMDDTAGPVTEAGGAAKAAPSATGRWRQSGRAWREGFFTNVLNPKVAVFYLAVLPQVAVPGGGIPDASTALLRSLLFGAFHVTIGLCWFTFLSCSLQKVRGTLLRPFVRRALDGGVGLLMVAFGVRLAVEKGA